MSQIASSVRVARELTALQAAIAGTVTTPEMPEYESERLGAGRELRNARPQAIVACATTSDVAEAIALTQRLGLRLAPRSGGHCFAGRSTTDGIVVDVGSMHAVSVTDGLVVVGPGARLDRLYDVLGHHGRTLPAGCGPTVGIAGLALGGGLGILGRSHGLTCDALVAAQVVLADGTAVECDADHHPDLFWALRGAGGGQFGVVTSLTFTTLAAPPAVAFALRWPAALAAAAIDAWQRWAPYAADAIDASLRVLASGDPGEPPAIHLVGAVVGPASDADALLDEFVARVGADPHTTRHHEAPYRAAKRWLDDLDAEPQHPSRVLARASKSGFFRRALPADAIEALLGQLSAARTDAQSRGLTFTPWGGAYNRVPSHATAFAHRDERFILEHVALAPAEGIEAARVWARRSHSIAGPWASGRVYPNFPDPELANWPWAYHGDNYARLRRVKSRYDAGHVFRFHQSL